MVADSRELLRLRIRGIVGIQNGFGRPDTYVSIYRCVSASFYDAAHREGIEGGLTNLRRPWPGAIHQGKRGSCILQNLFVRLIEVLVSRMLIEKGMHARRCTHRDVLTTVV